MNRCDYPEAKCGLKRDGCGCAKESWHTCGADLMAKAKQAKCEHKFRVSSVRGHQFKEIHCSKCDFRHEVPLSKDEVRGMKEQAKKDEKHTKDIHSLGWAYQREFYKWVKAKLSPKQCKQQKSLFASMNKSMPKGRKFKATKFETYHSGFKYKGYEMMKRMEAFAKKHPDVVICGSDDSFHAGSMVAFIPHRALTEYWGTTVVIIPQCTGEPALEMFFYPGHAIEIEKAIHGFNREFREKRRFERRENRYWPKP